MELFGVQRPRMLDIQAEYGLKPPQFFALQALDEPVPMSSVANVLRCDRSAVTWITDRLEERGYVERRGGPRGRRGAARSAWGGGGPGGRGAAGGPGRQAGQAAGVDGGGPAGARGDPFEARRSARSAGALAQNGAARPTRFVAQSTRSVAGRIRLGVVARSRS